MWESRVLGEISKLLWEPVLWFPQERHFQSAVHVVADAALSRDIGGYWPLGGVAIAVPCGSWTVDVSIGPGRDAFRPQRLAVGAEVPEHEIGRPDDRDRAVEVLPREHAQAGARPPTRLAVDLEDVTRDQHRIVRRDHPFRFLAENRV
jgi:hypothetical protein